MSSGRCTHWGVSGSFGCMNISPDLVYRDPQGHVYCVLHAPKYYVQPKGFFYGYPELFSHKSVQEKKDHFKDALDSLILAQKNNDTIRFDKIFWLNNFHNYIDSQNYPDKIFQFIDCSNIDSISNSKLKSIRFFNNKVMSLNIHNVEANEILMTGKEINGALITDSKIDSIVMDGVRFTHSVSINKIEPLSERGVWGRGLRIKNVNFDKIVKIEDLNFNLGERDITIEDSVFHQNLYYKNNIFSGWINLSRNKFVSSKAYFEKIDLTKIHLNRDCLEYLNFTDCLFPDRYSEMEIKSIKQSEEVYRDLKKISEDKKDYSLVSHWHYLEKEMTLLRFEQNRFSLMYIFLVMYKILCGYGEKPSRALFVLFNYLLLVFGFLILTSLMLTGFHKNIDWEIVHLLPFSYADFVPLFKTPAEISLSSAFDNAKGIQIFYNLGAALGRLFCIVQVALFSMSVRNHLKR